MSFTISGTSGLTFPNASTQSVAAALGLGQGQTWQNVTASRAASTTYTNSSGKPIAVSVYSSWGTRNNQEITVDGNIINHWAIENNYVAQAPFFFVVQNGSTYSINFGFTTWFELR